MTTTIIEPDADINNITVFIYTTRITNRLRYIFEHIFTDMFGFPISISTNIDDFKAHKGPKLNYSFRRFGNELFFYATPLLFERGIKLQRIKTERYQNNIPVFFLCKNNSDIPFDPFAATFYLISRYEEYLPHTKDKYQRYPAQESVAYKNNFLQIPVIDHWLLLLKACLQRYYPNIVFKKRTYTFTPTYDIDIAWSYKNKGLLRNLAGTIVAAKRLDTHHISQRLQVLLAHEPDPYDTYNFQLALHHRLQLRAIYFFLVGEYGEFDKNVSLNNINYQDLIQHIGDHARVGIHPSYASNSDKKILSKEIKSLSAVLKRVVIKSRQHYIKLLIPNTYQNLIDRDITEDYSMGYPSQLGFRAGTACPFYFYDLNLEIKTGLKVFPFMVMDVTLKNYLKLSPKQVLPTVAPIIDAVKAVNGHFISLWHNDSLSETDGWEQWRKVYEDVVGYAVNQ